MSITSLNHSILCRLCGIGSHLDRACSHAEPRFSGRTNAERTIEEIKTEAVRRAEVGQYPLIGLDPNDVREAFTTIHTSDKDEWAAGFMGVADRYMNEAKSLEKSDPAKANADYIRAWRLYSFGRWPVPASPGKQRSYEKASKLSWLMRGFWIRRSKS